MEMPPSAASAIGIDLGSRLTKIVRVGPAWTTESQVFDTGHDPLARLAEVLKGLRAETMVATGYGRNLAKDRLPCRTVTEIRACARAADRLGPGCQVAIDIGGQDAKGIKIANDRVVGFVMNDKCAAGTGRFLEVMAEVLGLELDQMGELSLKSKKKVRISSTCTVFAEQEVISRIAEGVQLEDILAGINEAIASRVCRMVQRLKIERDVVVTGGVAKNRGVVKALEDYLGFPVLVPEEPLLTGAIGAALMGRELTQKALESGKPVEKKVRRLEAATFFE